MAEEKIALVVPSIRQNCFDDFYKRWDEWELFSKVDLILMEDNPTKTFAIEKGIHYSWEDIESELKEKSWVIPRRSDTVRSFGYLMAYKLGYDYIMTLDDDCYPEHGFEDIVSGHLQCLNGRTKWYNTLSSGKPRGMPYDNLGKRQVHVNHGLWTNVLDYDAPTQLAAPFEENFSYDNRIVPNGSYFPFCGMNAMWRREATVLMYHLLMGCVDDGPTDVATESQRNLVKLPFDRFGDIWCGLFMKKIADALGWNVSTGVPYIRHERASNPFVNIKKEAHGLGVNEFLWQIVDAIGLDPILIMKKDAPKTYARFAKSLFTFSQTDGRLEEYKEYFKDLTRAMVTWSELFE